MYIVAFVTAKNAEEAQKIAKDLVEKKLAACVNVLKDIKSLYWWQGSVCDDSEVLMIIKSKKSYLKRIIKAVKTLHSYDVPEIIAMPIIGGNPDYLKWIEQSLKRE